MADQCPEGLTPLLLTPIENFADDPEISDDEIVYRRFGWNMAGGVDKYQVNDALALRPNHFSDYDAAKARDMGYPGGCMSVGLRSILLALKKDPSRMLEGYPGYGLAQIRVGDLRTLKNANGDACPHGIMAAGTDDEPWHAVVFDLNTGKKTASVQKAISNAADIVIPLFKS